MAKLTRAGRSISGKSSANKAADSLASLPLQTKLRMGRRGDAFEQEADRVADRVVNGPTSEQVSRQPEESEEQGVQQSPTAGQISRLLQRQDQGEEQEEPVQSQGEEEEEVQAQEEEEQAQAQEEEEDLQAQGEEEELQTQEEEEDVQAQEEEEDVQAQEEEEVQAQEEEPGAVQARALEGRELRNPDIEQRLLASKGGGFPLEGDIKKEMEDKFGTDFSSVRIHTDSDAADLADKLHAQAFTHGSDVYFNQGKYDPVTTEGKRLLAHELTHVVQQGATLRRQPYAHGTIQRQNDDDTPSTTFAVNSGAYDGASLDTAATPRVLRIPRVSIPNVKSRHDRAYGQQALTRPRG